jgi:hypothetical protein
LIWEDAACLRAGSESGDGEFIPLSNGKTTRMSAAFQMVAQSHDGKNTNVAHDQCLTLRSNRSMSAVKGPTLDILARLTELTAGYWPMWDVQLAEWAKEAIDGNQRGLITDGDDIVAKSEAAAGLAAMMFYATATLIGNSVSENILRKTDNTIPKTRSTILSRRTYLFPWKLRDKPLDHRPCLRVWVCSCSFIRCDIS